jgi:metal-sulfur cluster biosynthetic enzyme
VEAAVRTSHKLVKTAFGCPVAGNRPRTAQRAAQDRPSGVDGVEEARVDTPPNPPSTPPLLRYGGGAAERHYCCA